MNNQSEIVSFIWSVADLIRDTFKRGKYQDVILPLTVLRRLDCVLASTKDKVRQRYLELKNKGLKNLDPQLRRASGYSFYNTSRFVFEKLVGDSRNLAANLRNYINCFSDNMKEVLYKFDLDNTINKLDEGGLLFLVLEKFKNVDLHPENVSNLQMGYIFEELIRKFNEALNENPGEHFTPREVIRLMVNLILSQDTEALSKNHIVRTVYDPCCGSGGMLTLSKQRIVETNKNADVHLFGQESQPETFAICKSDLYMKSSDGRDAENIAFGSTLSNDQHADKRFDYMLANPPYGKDWKKDLQAVETEARKGYAGRFGAGTPRISDGQLLFLQHMLSRMHTFKKDGSGRSRVAIVMNGSPLFTGEAGKGESEIRRWIFENDWLEAIIALPEQLFYNTSIATYVWVLSNCKRKKRKGKVQLINATTFWVKMQRNLGDKRREISSEQIEKITSIFTDFKKGDHSKIFDIADFGYRKITIERPLRLNFQASPERIERLKNETAFQNLAVSKKHNKEAKRQEVTLGRKEQQKILDMLVALPGTLFKNREDFLRILDDAIVKTNLKVPVPIKKAILSALSERDDKADICRDSKRNPEPDSELRDYESVPLKENICQYFEREVKPHVPDAWIDEAKRDHKDGEVGKIGYEINFNRYFYKYQPPRPLAEIEADIRKVETDIIEMLKEVRNE